MRGFTLLEVVLVVALIGILGVSIAPRMTFQSTANGFAAQQRLIAQLGQLQLRAMNDRRTDVDYCYKMVFAKTTPAYYGTTTQNVTSGDPQASCSSVIDPNHPNFIGVNVNQLASEGLSLRSAVQSIDFQSSGVANVSCYSGCSAPYEISFVSADSESYSVCVSSLGDIYACAQ